MGRTRCFAAVVAVLAAVMSGCSSSPAEDRGSGSGSGLSVESSTVETKVGSVERPTSWEPSSGTGKPDHVGSFVLTEAGQVVGQMDVFVGKVAPGSPADVVSEGVQGERALNFANLRSVRRELTDVPGAASAALDVSTYATAQGEPARSIEQLAIAPNGSTLTVRISTARSAFDAELFEELLKTMRLEKRQTS